MIRAQICEDEFLHMHFGVGRFTHSGDGYAERARGCMTRACSSCATSVMCGPASSRSFDKMSKLDMMNQFVTPTGGGIFACPGGVAEGGFIGQRLFEKA